MGANIMDKNIWGVECSIDLKNCNPETIRSAKELEKFLVKVCKHIKVTRWGDPIIANFGKGEKIAGYSIVQLIETSLVSGHFVDSTNAAYVNIFSCDYFDPIKAANFTKKFFGATDMDFIVNFRQR